MATLTIEGKELRRRLCGHLRRLYEEHKFKTKQAMAKELGVHKGHLSNMYNGVTEVGLDVAWKMHRIFGESMNHICDDLPEERFLPPAATFLTKKAASPPPRRAPSAR